MWEIIQKSGVLIYPIIALSIISVAIFLERLYTLRSNKFVNANFVSKLVLLIKQGRYDDAEAHCAGDNSAIGQIALEIIVNRNKPWEQLVSATESVGKPATDGLYKFLEAQSTIVALAPLLGLLGTILGIIKIFGVLSIGGAGDAQALSGGISEALVNTAGGLFVAITTHVFYYITKYKADKIAYALELESGKLLNMVSQQKSGQTDAI